MNAQAKHTPGPWRAETVKPVPVNTKAIVISAADGPVAFATVENAPLIAAAPELLEALSGLLGFCQILRCNDLPQNVLHALASNHRIKDARAAIAKATGEQP